MVKKKLKADGALPKQVLLQRFRSVIHAKQDELNACRRTFNEAQSWTASAVRELLVVAGYRPIITTDRAAIKRYFQEHRP